ncbi:hypothetical protein MMC30_004140 [Trapelia coarctata]|nr:hypothetical protein [Trapelia coarctata]
MSMSRTALRSIRHLRNLPKARNGRYYATAQEAATSSSSSNGSNTSAAIIGGMVGGGLVFAGGYTYYHFSGAKTMVNTARETKAYFEKASKKLSEATPEPNEALQWLRQTATSYAAFIPGAKGYVNTAFDDLDAIHQKHGSEMDKIVKEAYEEIKGITKDKGMGMSLETAEQVWEALQKHLKRIGDLAGDATQQILDNHPEIKAKVGGSIDQLKSMGDKYGPEAKKQVDQTWEQIQNIVKSGVSMDTANKIRSLIEEKVEMIKKMGDEAWKKGMKEAKPYLDKSPKVKELIEKNADSLKQGNVAELWQKVKESVESGNTESIENYIKSTVDKGKSQGMSMAGGAEQYINSMMPKLSLLLKMSAKHGKQAENLVKETVDELQEVLTKRFKEAEELTEEGTDDVKKESK